MKRPEHDAEKIATRLNKQYSEESYEDIASLELPELYDMISRLEDAQCSARTYTKQVLQSVLEHWKTLLSFETNDDDE